VPEHSKKWLLIIISILLLTIWILGLSDLTDISQVNLDKRFLSPSGVHLFGTDELGRDILKRTMSGFSYSFSLVIFALAGASVIGLCIGIIAGFYENRIFSQIVDQLINIVWSLPGLIFFIAVTTYFGRSFYIILIAMALVSWVPIARVVRLEIAIEKKKEYVNALKAFGFNNRHVILSIVANTKISFLVVVLSVSLDLVAAESGLSFLGLGIQPPNPSLGTMIYNGLTYSSMGWWMLCFPLLVLITLVMTLKMYITQLEDLR
jgi:peptide/nickel transport system permease protein